MKREERRRYICYEVRPLKKGVKIVELEGKNIGHFFQESKRREEEKQRNSKGQLRIY